MMNLEINSSGNIAGYVDDNFYQVSFKHPQYAKLKKAVHENDSETFIRVYREDLVDFSCEKYEIEDKIEVTKETIEYRGHVIDDPVLIEVIKSYSTQCDALKRFIDNLFLNPQWESIKQLGAFLKHNNFPLTEDGCFLGYKAVRTDYMDKYTGTIDNSVGRTVTMPRADVAFDPAVACSSGLHVGTYNYAQSYGGNNCVIVVVKVNPAHCVSVPHDHNSEKLRCSQYQVIGDCVGTLSLSMIYTVDGAQISPANYFADLRNDGAARKRRPSVTTITADDLAPAKANDKDLADEDWEDEEDEEETEYYCDSCDWIEEIDTVEDVFGSIAYCFHCGNELEKR